MQASIGVGSYERLFIKVKEGMKLQTKPIVTPKVSGARDFVNLLEVELRKEGRGILAESND
jgi:hypothetical protein